MKFRSLLAGLSALLLLTMAVPGQAEAYVDPGGGSLIWQALAAGFVGSLFYIRRIWSWVSRRFEGRQQEKTEQP